MRVLRAVEKANGAQKDVLANPESRNFVTVGELKGQPYYREGGPCDVLSNDAKMLATTCSQGNEVAIFVIDDDETSLILVTAALEQLGVDDVRVAEDGRHALQLYDRMAVKPEVIICDIYMPNMDGIEILSALEERQYQGGIILVSGADPEMLELAQVIARSGDMQFLGAVTKPVSSEALAPLLGRQVLF